MEESFQDETIKKEIWYGNIPIVFNLPAHEVASLQSPFPYYIMIPRHSYLSLYIQDVKQHFEDYVSNFAAKEHIWFEYDEVPLRWHIPVGVLFDLLFHETKTTSKKSSLKSLPWQITVHFSNFPTEILTKFSSYSTTPSPLNLSLISPSASANSPIVSPSSSLSSFPSLEFENETQWTYINSLKECLYAQLGTTKSIMTLSKANQSKLWNAIKECNSSDYEKMNQQLMEGYTVKNYPIKILCNTKMKRNQAPLVQLLSLSKDYLLNKNLKDFLIEQFSQPTNMMLQHILLTNNVSDVEKWVSIFDCTVIIQGIQPPLDTPMLYLCENFIHPDHCLYISLLVQDQ